MGTLSIDAMHADVNRVSRIYVVEMERRAYKIGHAEDPRSRLPALQTGCPFRLTLMDTVEVPWAFAPQIEASLHKRYSDYRLMGEWFARPRKYGHASFAKDILLAADLLSRANMVKWEIFKAA